MAALKVEAFNERLRELSEISPSANSLLERTGAGAELRQDRTQALVNRVAEFGGLDEAAKSAEGMDLIAQVYEAFELEARINGQTGIGASGFALDTMIQTFGAGALTDDMVESFLADVDAQGFGGLVAEGDLVTTLKNIDGYLADAADALEGSDGVVSPTEAGMVPTIIEQQINATTSPVITVNGLIEQEVKDILIAEILAAVNIAGVAQAEVTAEASVTSAPEGVSVLNAFQERAQARQQARNERPTGVPIYDLG